MSAVNFFLVGGPRCGSTFVYRHLEKHPEIMFSTKKETHHFSTDFHADFDQRHGVGDQVKNRFGIRSEQEYLAQYLPQPAEKIVGDASTSHFYSRTAAEEIFRFNPDARIMIVLRDPIAQMQSWHGYLLHHREEGEPDFRKAMERNKSGFNPAEHSDILWFPERINYRYIADYATHVERFQKTFPAKNLYVSVFNDCVTEPEQEFRRMFSFLGVEENFADTLEYEKTNSNKQLMFAGLFRSLVDEKSFIRRTGKALLPKKAGSLMHKGLVKGFTRSGKRQQMDPDFRRALMSELRPGVDRLGNMLGRDLAALWGYDS